MDFSLGEDRQMLVDSLSRFLADNFDWKAREAAIGSDEGFSRELWNELAELGVIGSWFAEDAGGYGGGAFDVGATFGELGRALALRPNSARALNRLGVVQVGRQQPMKALDSFRATLQEQPDHSAAQLNIAIVLHRHAPPNVSQPRVHALAAYRKYLEMDPKGSQAVQRIVADLDRELNSVALAAHVPTNTVAVVSTNDATFIVQAVFPNPAQNGAQNGKWNRAFYYWRVGKNR